MENLQINQYYHIYNHANGDDNLFREAKNYPFFLSKYHIHIDPIAETIAWCLMPNHFHLLVRIKDEEELERDFPKFRTLENLSSEEKQLQLSYLLSKQFANFFSSYTQSFNKVYQRRGSLFLKNFKRKEVEDQNYLFHLILYIHLNPIKHGFTNELTEWEWSSFHHLNSQQPKLSSELFGTTTDYLNHHQEKRDCFKEYLHIENQILTL
ncbi:transposase [Pedobacter puniceum]|uniref:Transposase n=1 Tax=Pedobacter puniceum TaxID=2666136 RepID=A0A7K0FJZ9_9SPHI|nr:transposase [Pedobacter puniceum]MRX46238.1 transposase [Pedobacter puniceum]